MKGKYHEMTTVQALMKKNCLINYSSTKNLSVRGVSLNPKQIEVGFSRKMGNNSWGKVDFLKEKGYFVTNTKGKLNNLNHKINDKLYKRSRFSSI